MIVHLVLRDSMQRAASLQMLHDWSAVHGTHAPLRAGSRVAGMTIAPPRRRKRWYIVAACLLCRLATWIVTLPSLLLIVQTVNTILLLLLGLYCVVLLIVE